jgi:hypothetical protein
VNERGGGEHVRVGPREKHAIEEGERDRRDPREIERRTTEQAGWQVFTQVVGQQIDESEGGSVAWPGSGDLEAEALEETDVAA